MTTPIYDYLDNYRKSEAVRLHMPGHKGKLTKLGIEDLDLTEIVGADELYSPEGIIAESEKNAGKLFGANTFYSTEGSSLSIRAMLFLVAKFERINGREPYILAARNVHKVYVNTAALLNIKTDWIMGKPEDSYEVCRFSAKELEERIEGLETKPSAVYITSPDYLGNMADIGEIARVCHEKGILLMVDNAHGAYLKFLSPSLHPMDLGADMCVDSAHKTLPVLTGGAYLHISKNGEEFFARNAKHAFEMFGSTSPSYLIMASLDLANEYMESLPEKLNVFVPKVLELKEKLVKLGYKLTGNETLKIGLFLENHTGKVLAERFMERNAFLEYFDEDHLVMMVTTENEDGDLEFIYDVLSENASLLKEDRGAAFGDCELNEGAQITECSEMAEYAIPEEVVKPWDAIYADFEELPACECVGRVLAASEVSCPPAVPVYMIGERIDKSIFPGKTLKVLK